MIRFSYDGHERIAEPHVAGIKGGRQGMLAYQTGGTSSSNRVPSWKLFYLDKMSGLEALGDAFPGPRPSPSGKHTTWDETYEIVT